MLAFVVSKLEKCRPVQTKTVFYQRSIGQPAKVQSLNFKCCICDIVISVLIRKPVIDMIRLIHMSQEHSRAFSMFHCSWLISLQMTIFTAFTIVPIIFSNNLKLRCHYFDWHTHAHTRSVSQRLFRNISSTDRFKAYCQIWTFLKNCIGCCFVTFQKKKKKKGIIMGYFSPDPQCFAE